ncbi:hypothetical protein CEXT_665581 [Caerostris extrusa]|uniref:Uncharacterized protein n=1 Tax=Caerostris extrusa TaxID=172846 RepID=A0AAV4XMW3_CAEEX|nr:hypothetical protein CEXT_665581 [Caerostris extrusa]
MTLYFLREYIFLFSILPSSVFFSAGIDCGGRESNYSTLPCLMLLKGAQWRERKTVREVNFGQIHKGCYPAGYSKATLLDFVSDNNPIMQDILDCRLSPSELSISRKIRIFTYHYLENSCGFQITRRRAT